MVLKVYMFLVGFVVLFLSLNNIVNSLVLDDSEYEENETFNIALTDPSHGGSLDSPTTDIITTAEDKFEDSGITLPGVKSASLAWGDYDNDGDLDLAICGYSSEGRISKIYKNNGNGTFTDIDAGLVGVDVGSLAWGDYDNDGDLDLAICGRLDSLREFITKIYRNNGNDTFTDIEVGLRLSPVALFCGSVAWGDYDNDGDLDLAVCGGFSKEYSTLILGFITRIYRNDGNNTFTDIQAGLTGVEIGSIAWGDYDNDGDLDLAVCGQHGHSPPENKIYKNNNGTFTDIGAGLPRLHKGSLAWGDYDNDGNLDLALCGIYGTTGSPDYLIARIYRNNGNDTFTDINAGLTGVSNSVAWGDYDNDGDLDLAICGSSSGLGDYVTKIYRNDGSNTFTDIQAGLPGANSSVAWGDYDNDGDLDLALCGTTGSGRSTTYITKIYKNNLNNSNTAPFSPADLTYELESIGSILLKWSAGYDAETPEEGLYYNLRAGTSSRASDIVSGVYGSPLLGNYLRPKLSDGQLGVRLENLPAGTYYWSVQTIDTGLKASPWSDEEIFVVSPTHAISGEVTLEGGNASVTEALLSLSGTETDTVQPAQDSSYSFTDLGEGIYIIIPSLEEYYFFPASRSYPSLPTDQSSQDFQGLHESYDSDGDELPDWWEWTYFGEGNLEQEADDDPDGDGYTNLDEYTYNTDPNNVKSKPLPFISGEVTLEGGVTFEGNSIIWVKAPEMSFETPTTIYMYYGNPDAEDAQDIKNVWDENYVMVQHLEEAPANGIAGHIDSTINDNDGTPENFGVESPSTTDGSGKTDGADEFDGIDDYVDCGDNSSLNINDDITIIAWINTNKTSYQTILEKYNNNAPWSGYGFRTGGGGDLGKIGFWSNNIGSWKWSTDTINYDQWNHVAITGTGSLGVFYINGQEDSTFTYSGPGDSSGEILFIGYTFDGGFYFEGIIDEVRISDVARSPAWIKACYYSENDELITFGGEEDITGDNLVVGYEEWNCRRPLYIDPAGKIDENLTDFPLCVKLDSSRITYTGSGGVDIRFTDALGNPLQYEIEDWKEGSSLDIDVTDVLLILSGASTETTHPDAAGNYLFTGLEEDVVYTVTPTLEGYYFSPPFRLYPPIERNQLNQDFTGLYETYDSDMDALPDWWELENFDNLEQTADDDPDEDGYTNLEEYTYNTDPNDAGSIPPTIWYVDDDASLGGDGKSWNNAFRYLQDALYAASAGEEIWVAQGKYNPDQGNGLTSGDRFATFQLKNGVILKGGFKGGNDETGDEYDISTYETILSGDLNGNDESGFVNYEENSYNVVTGSDTNLTATLDGFTITGGNANAPDTAATFRQRHGGGLMAWMGSPTVRNCVFSFNRAPEKGESGGGVYIMASDEPVEFTNCVFYNNSTHWFGGGMYIGEASHAEITNCIFAENSAAEGGGISVFCGNTEPFPRITNCTFSGNTAWWYGRGEAIYNGFSNIIVTNCILWDNGANKEILNYPRPQSSALVSYSNVRGGYEGEGNIDSDPLLGDASNPAGPDGVFYTWDDGLQLYYESPCVDAANGDSAPSTDILGFERIDVYEIPNTGTGTPDYVDMGAYEFMTGE